MPFSLFNLGALANVCVFMAPYLVNTLVRTPGLRIRIRYRIYPDQDLLPNIPGPGCVYTRIRYRIYPNQDLLPTIPG